MGRQKGLVASVNAGKIILTFIPFASSAGEDSL
jgi:hypothetical protein